MNEAAETSPECTTAEIMRFAQWRANLSDKEARLLLTNDPRKPVFPGRDETTAAFFRVVQEQAERRGQFKQLW